MVERDVHKLNELQTAIIKTVIFFDMFSYPLTSYEVWRYLGLAAEFAESDKEVRELVKMGFLVATQGFYYLPGQERLLGVRKQRYHYTNRKLKIARRAVRLFKLLPTIKFVALSNLIGRHNLRDGSDIDLFIVAKPNRIWITRLFCAGLMKVLGQRPTDTEKRDKICLSFYIDASHLNLSNLADGPDDGYFHYWLAGLHPLYDGGAYHHQLIGENEWLKQYLPNGAFVVNNQSYRESPRYWLGENIVVVFWRKGIDLLERGAHRLQMIIMPEALKEKANVDSCVIIRPGVLKLYLIDRRCEIMRRYQERLRRFFNE